MLIDIYSESHALLERLTNSVHDRGNTPDKRFLFTLSEQHLVEEWLEDILSRAGIKKCQQVEAIDT